MRNLKRALSLTLASVMLLGMMVVGSSAAGFPDVDENDNVEAIEVLNAVEVILGYDNGDFGPDDLVTRAQMAVIMAKLLNLDYQYYEATCPFTDVPEWARGYVGACYARGITSGYSATTYGPNDGITPVQAASMMMRALGYFKYSQDYSAGFEVATVSQGTDIGIFKGVGSSANTQMTRNQVAKMALNALCAEMVTFTGTPGMEVNGVVVGYRPEYTPRTSTEIKYQAIESRTSDVSGGNNLNRGQYYIQLGEELYDGKLTRKFERDEFERPSINWQYNGKEIGTYVNYELKTAEFLTGVTGAQMYDELTYTTINDNDLLTYVDGVDSEIEKKDLVRSNKNDLRGTGTGVLTEVFVDLERDEITITSINTWLAKANSDYNSTNDSLSLKVFTNRDTAAKVSSSTKIVDGAKVAAAENVKKDEYKLVYMSGKDNTSVYNDYARFDVVKIFDVEILPETAVTKWAKSDTKVSGEFTADGTVYKTNEKAYYDGGNVLYDYNETLLTDMSYNVYLDRYGNAIGVDLAEGTKNYVFITGYDRVGSNISVKTADAAAIFLDGTMDVITVNVKDTNKYIERIEDTNANFVQWTDQGTNGYRAENRWYTYTVNNSGVYTLKPAERMFWTDYDAADFGSENEKILNCANLYVDDSRANAAGVPSYTNLGRAYGNDDSIYITVEAGSVDHSANGGNDKDAIVDVKGAYTGAQNVKLSVKPSDREDITEAYVYTVYDSNYYIIASIVLGDAQGTAANYAYILGGAKNERIEYESSSARASGDATYYWEFDAVLNGEKQTLTAKSKYRSTIDELKKFHVQELRFDGDYVTSIVDVKDDKVMGNNVDKKTIDKMDVYDVGHVAAADAYGEKVHTGCTSHTGSAYGWGDHRLNGKIELVGRTLYTERPTDVGLGLAADAKAVLVQIENGKEVSTQCSSVSEAIGRLADADTRAVPAAEGLQFQGRIVAVLKDGVAQWVVIISDTELRTNDKDYGTTTGYSFVEKMDANGNKIAGEWLLTVPTDVWRDNPNSTTMAAWMANAGCTSITVSGDKWNFTYKGVSYAGQNVTVNAPKNPDTYEVTIAPAENGTVSVSPAGKLEQGTEVTITATPATADYEVDTVTVKETTSGAAVTVSADNKFTMPAANVTVTVTFKEKAPEGSVSVINSVDGAYAVLQSDTTKIATSAQAGDKITLVPSIAVKFTAGVNATPDAQGWYTVTGDVDVTYAAKSDAAEGNWTFVGGRWVGVDGTVPSFVNPGPLYTGLASLSRFSLARAVVTDDSWLDEAMNDTENTYEITVGDYSWTGASVPGAGPLDPPTFQLTPAANSNTAAAALAFVQAFVNSVEPGTYPDAPEMDVSKVEGGKGIIWADVTPGNAGNSAVFTKYDKDLKVNEDFAGKPLTAAEIATALSAVERYADKKVTFSANDVTIEANGSGKAIASDKTVVTFGSAVPTRVYKITYPGGVAYGAASDSVTVKDVAPGVKYLLDEKTGMGAGVEVTMDATAPATKPGTASFTVPAQATAVDVVYVPAMKIDTTTNYGISNGAVLTGSDASKTALTAWIDSDGDGFNEKVNGTHIQVGAKITFSKPASPSATYTAGQAVVVEVATKTAGPVLESKLTFPIDKDLNIKTDGEESYVTVPGWTADNGGTFTMVANVKNAVSVKDTKIYVDDGAEALEILGSEGSYYVLIPNMTDKNGETLTLAYWDADDKEWKEANTPTNIDDQNIAKVNVNDLSAASEEGVIKVYRAYEVENGALDSEKWIGYENDYSTAEDAENTTLGAKTYFPITASAADRTIYIEGKAGVMLGVKGSKSILPAASVVTPVDVSAANVGVWTYVVDCTMAKDDIEEKVTFAADAIKFDVSKDGLAANATTEAAIAIGGITINDTSVVLGDVNVVGFTASKTKTALAGLEKATFTIKLKSDKTGYEMTIKNGDTAVEANTGDAIEDAGFLEIEIAGVTVFVTAGQAKGN